ncbi:lysozyme [Novosphingobium sp. RL4]|uniref:lysozyme n=1 Tax=Novosphingobium sp. RL4 TaxID=3109595 RepID=UPI002D7989A2|nr:lysozyme [Novosphingobium sp. RL4]WRT91934.1 lysozyme [Novosphingobium sp. RL4]
MDVRKPIFDAVRGAAPKGLFNDASNVLALDNLLDAFGVARPVATGLRTSAAGIALMHKWEGCARKRGDGQFEAYPDPGSKDGEPWTIGWGSTGSDIGPGTVWSQAQCDARFVNDLVRYEKEVRAAIGSSPTTQAQFDALVSFHYNTGAIGKATLTKRHIAGDYAGAAVEFGKWIYNDGAVMEGLKRRRADEAALYAGGAA